MPTCLYDGAGAPVRLGREIARGGEGAVLELAADPSTVAKVYHNAVERDKVLKLQAMARFANAGLTRVAAWPQDTLHQSPGGPVVGILLPKITGHREIHQLYSPAERKVYFPRADWSFLIHVAMNCAAAFEAIHEAGHVVGDVNQSGVLVSPQGTVRLIDCDSFQIRCNGQLFRCVVGVPEYTAPELQGTDFRTVERTSAHDAFGLALMIFHLLFMGRHPFAGRYSGSGDMPIQKAIAEGRFAFSKYASAQQMTPPPFALPLHALPEPVATMFERAFAHRRHNLERPQAAEWRGAMESLKKSLRQCALDKGHLYPGQARVCPWCDVLRQGGPNFFISVQIVTGGLRLELPPLDLDPLFQRIDAIPPPPRERPQYPRAQAYVPTPLPEAVLDGRMFLQVARIVTVVAAAVAVVGPFTHLLVTVIGLAHTVIFAVIWAVLTGSSGYRNEMRRRHAKAKALRQRLKNEQQEWDAKSDAFTQQFRYVERRANDVRLQAVKIRPEFERARLQLNAQSRETQLEEFLETKFIRDYRIPRVGAGRLATLLSYGIETAADVSERQLDAIPGFGPSTIGEMMAWRRSIERSFVFDAGRPPPIHAVQSILMKFRQLQQGCLSELTAAAQLLEEVSSEARSQFIQSSQLIEQLVAEVRQADADLKA